MQQGNESNLKGHGWDEALNETRQFLETWYFYIAASGLLYARPHQPSVTSRDVQVFLRRLDVFGDDLPQIMAFDFTKLIMSPAKWLRIADMLRKYAARIDATSVVISGNLQNGGLALILHPNSRSLSIASDLAAEVFQPVLTA